jgi:uncharacterized membrane protein YgcG
MIAVKSTAVLCAALLTAQAPYVFAQQPQPAGTSQQPQQVLTAGQLDSLVAPIALYPDPILSQVLVASTYPLEIVQAARWLKENANLTGQALVGAAAKQPWDASVQAMVALPEVLNRLNTDLSWTTDLGNAFLAQQEDVMAAVQRMRKKATASGALQSTPQQTVTTATENGQNYVEIEPANTQVVYVPEYNPEAVWGPPPEYYPYPPIYYPPSGAAVAAGAISFGVGIAVGAIWANGGGWGWNAGWGRGNVVVNNNFINNNHFSRVNVGSGNNWVHNPSHRAGVPYNNRGVANRFNGGQNNLVSRPTVNQTQQRLNQMGQRGNLPAQGGANRAAPGIGQGGRGAAAAAIGQGGRGNLPAQGGANRMAPGNIGQGAGNNIGNRSMNPGFQGKGAFGGMNQGGARTMMNSNRGSSSRGFGGGGMRGGGGGMRGGGGRRR